MRNIRIGNDIRLKVELKQADGFDNILPLNNSNIKQVRCYLINTSFPKEPTDEDKKKFRRVGFPDFYRPTAHNINNAGFPSYHMHPANACNYDRFLPDFHDFHWWPGFRGFGIHPEHFHDHCGHMFGMGPKPYAPFDEHDIHPWYLADSKVLANANTISCMFPAMEQKLCGTYKLVVVLITYEHGWGRHNLRTFTLDKGDVFKLVDGENPEECGESGPIYIDVDDKGTKERQIETVFKRDIDCFYMNADSTMKMGGKDLNQNIYQIVAKLKDGSTVLYNPEHWPFDNLIFESEDPDIVDVDQFGTLYAKSIPWSYKEKALHYMKKFDPFYKDESVIYNNDGDPRPIGDDSLCANEDTHYEPDTMVVEPDSGMAREWPSTKIYVKLIDSEDIVCCFTVTVMEMDTLKIGFDEEDDVAYIDYDDEFLKDYSAKAASYTVPNSLLDAGYMWILSQRRIHYIKGMIVEDETSPCCDEDKKCKCSKKSNKKPYDLFKKEEQEEITSDVSSGFRIPLIQYGTKDGFYYYRSAAPIREGNVKMKIKFE